MRKVILIASGLTAAAGLATAALLSRPAAPPPPPPATVETAPPPSEEAVAETAALTASRGLAWRDGTGLSLLLKDGGVLTLTDRGQCGDLPCPPSLTTHFRYLGWDSLNGGYRLSIAPAFRGPMVLSWDDEPTLVPPETTGAGASASQPQPQPPPPARHAGASQDLDEWLADIADSRNKTEPPHLEQTKGRVRRDGAQLTLLLADQRRLTFSDDVACGQTPCPPQLSRSFTYDGDSPDGRYHVIEAQADESATALLVDGESGRTTELLGPPLFSPDGHWAAAALADLETPRNDRLELWDLRGASPDRAFVLSAAADDDTIYTLGSWNDANHLRLGRESWGADEASATSTEVVLTHSGSGWHLDSRKPRK